MSRQQLGPPGPRPGATSPRLVGATLVAIVCALSGLLEVAAYLTYQYVQGVRDLGPLHALQRVMPRWFLWAAFTPLFLSLANRFSFDRSGWRTLCLVHVPAGLVLSLLHVALWGWLRHALIDPNPDRTVGQEIALALANLYVPDAMTFFAILGLLLGISYYRHHRERELAEARLALRTALLETDLARARLHALTLQLRPHFLFNTLNSISELMHRSVPEADQMIARLGDLLRQVIEKTDRSEVSVREEMDLVEAYLEIERLRCGDGLAATVEVSHDTLDAVLPPLSVQPLVENAVRHGTDRAEGRGRIEVTVVARRRRLLVEVRDNGPGPAHDFQLGDSSTTAGRVPEADPGPRPVPQRGGGGIALANLRRRLEQRYGDQAVLTMRPCASGGTEVLLEMPLEHELESAPRGAAIG